MPPSVPRPGTAHPLRLPVWVSMLLAVLLCLPATTFTSPAHAAGETAAATGAGGTISGRLTRADGKGASGVNVWGHYRLISDWGTPYLEYAVQTVSDSNGNYTLTFPENGVYVVHFTGWHGTPYSYYVPEFYNDVSDGLTAEPITVAGGAAITGIDAFLRSEATEFVTLEGQVTDAAGHPIPDIWVSAHCADDRGSFVLWNWCRNAKTDTQGRYVVPDMSRGEYRLTFQDDNGVYAFEAYDNVADVYLGKNITSTVAGEAVQVPTVVMSEGAVTKTVSPEVTGTPQVGKPLTANPGTWSVADPTFTYQWGRDDGTKIPGATSRTYTPTADDLGKRLNVDVTASHGHLVSGWASSFFSTEVVAAGTEPDPEPDPDPDPEPDPEPQPEPVPVSVVSAPTLVGTPAVGQALTVTSGAWNPATVMRSYQWLRNGRPISGATYSAYTPTAGDRGASLAVRVTATPVADGYLPTTVTTRGVKVAAGTLSNSVAPKLTGIGRAGKTLSVSPGSWGPGEVKLTFQWLRNGKAIEKATGTSYVVKRTDRRTTLSVRVLGTKTGYTPLVRTSGGKRIR